MVSPESPTKVRQLSILAREPSLFELDISDPDPADSCQTWEAITELRQTPPEDSCKTWEAITELKQKPTLAALASREPTSFQQGKKGWRGIDEERYLSFRVHPSDCIGLEVVSTTSGTMNNTSLLVVATVEDESAFTKTVGGHPGIRPGDVIVEVNGRRGTAAVLEEVLQQAAAASRNHFHGHITIVARPRPASFDVEMIREGPHWKTLGITVMIDKTNPRCALVQSVGSDGLVPDWNRTRGSLRICAGDLINALDDDVEAMCNEVREGSKGSVLRFRVVASVAGQAAMRRAIRRASRLCEGSPGSATTDSPNSEDAETLGGSEAKTDRLEQVEPWLLDLARAEAACKVSKQEAVAKSQAMALANAVAERLLREQDLRREIDSLALEGIRSWSMDECGMGEDVPPPVKSPVRRAMRQDGLLTWAQFPEDAPVPLRSPVFRSSDRDALLTCSQAVAGDMQRETSTTCKGGGVNNMLQFALDDNAYEDDCMGELANVQLDPVGPKFCMIGFHKSSQHQGCEERALSDVSTDFTPSGARTPPVEDDHSSPAPRSAQGLTVLV